MLFGSSTTIIDKDDGEQQPAKPAPPPAQVPTRTEPRPTRSTRPSSRTSAGAMRLKPRACAGPPCRPTRSPLTAPRTKQIERQTGVPYAIVDRNYDELDRRARIDAVPYGQVRRRRRRSPRGPATRPMPPSPKTTWSGSGTSSG